MTSSPSEYTGPGASLAFSTTCYHCGRTFISCIREFPVPYACDDCVPSDVKQQRARWLAAHPVCVHGHEMDGHNGNVRWTKGRGHCRLCWRAGKRRQAAREATKRASLRVHSGTTENNGAATQDKSPTPRHEKEEPSRAHSV